MSGMTRDMRPLDYETGDSTRMKDWLAAQGAPAPASLPLVLQEIVAKGCKLFDDGRGNTVSMLCFEMGNQFVHVFVFDEATRHYVDLTTERWERKRGWNQRALEQDGLLIAVATRGDTDALNAIW